MNRDGNYEVCTVRVDVKVRIKISQDLRNSDFEKVKTQGPLSIFTPRAFQFPRSRNNCRTFSNIVWHLSKLTVETAKGAKGNVKLRGKIIKWMFKT